MGNPTVYVLVSFKKGKNELGIGNMDSIAIPKTFVSLSKLEDKIRMIKNFISEKTDVAFKWPKHSVLGDEDSSMQSELKAGTVISFSEDKRVLEITRDAMLKTKTKSARSKQILKSSTPKSQVVPKAIASVPCARKSLPPVFGNTSNLGLKQQSKRKTTEANPAKSKEPTADEESDLGVRPLVSSESEESSENSGIEEEDWLAASPPRPSRKKVPRTDILIDGSASNNGASHRNENILTPPVSRCNTPSSFRTPNRREKINKVSNDLASLNDEESSVDNINYHNDENSQEAQILEHSNSLQQLNEENTFYKEQMNQSLIDYESMKAEYEVKLNEKDELIKSLRENNPLVLAQTLRESVLLLDTTLANLPSNSRQSVAANAANSAAPLRPMVKLHQDYNTMIDPSSLRLAISYGKSGTTTREMGKMVGTLMEALWDKAFMASHSLSGRKAPSDKSDPIKKNLPAKPAIPADARDAIIQFTMKFWESKHNMRIPATMVNPLISQKLLTEHTSVKKALNNDESVDDLDGE